MLAVRGRRRSALAHVVRLRRFANAVLGSEVDMARLAAEAQKDYPDNVVKRLVDHRVTEGKLQVRVRWLGFPEIMDTWGPVANLVEDVSDIVEDYLRGHREDGICARMLQRYFGTRE